MSQDMWEQRVQQLEAEGLTRSDAQAVADAEVEKEGRKTRMSQHTPGPWKMVDLDNARFCVVHEPTSSYICAVDDMTDDDNEANACLIAAAPSLLYTAKHLVSVVKFGHQGDTLRVALKDVEEAIAKAEGRA